MAFWLIVILALSGVAWIRFAPSDPAVWHVDPKVSSDQDLAEGVRRRIDGGDAVFRRLHGIILETPRTEIVAGGVDAGKVTYVTRSQWMGFPDYTTVQKTEDHLELYARLRFGASDLGTNKQRVEGWLARLDGDGDG